MKYIHTQREDDDGVAAELALQLTLQVEKLQKKLAVIREAATEAYVFFFVGLKAVSQSNHWFPVA